MVPRIFSTQGISQLAKIYRHYRREHLKISKMAKFSSQEIAKIWFYEVRKFYRSFVVWAHKVSARIQFSHFAKL